MDLLHIFIILLTAAAVIAVFYYAARRIYNIPKQNGHYEHVNRVHKWIEIGMIISYFVIIVFYQNIFLLTLYFSLFFLVRAVMEWRYRPEEKQYILYLFNIGLIFVFGIILFFMNG
ncbi:DUF4181 domain-containing protein [Bacillus sp. ISL-51]|uniref:DUF4181 domain-containing protein n=1 Tax=Bacteria TaxID=2 RepID=UPI001BE7C235|nr:DUF4181 domain-containing protein [Bacillus sp. ISL-51]MBT2635332.1 DUF4181 domain-containing protein [Bacillus sp. ISL-26]MBT2713416.1 DUF4181 domain-containing protein [Pseudomonas sp. ISL-88]